jgi:hypothetical protein
VYDVIHTGMLLGLAVDEKGIIYKYIVEIEDKVVPGNYDLVATYKKDGIENKSKGQYFKQLIDNRTG